MAKKAGKETVQVDFSGTNPSGNVPPGDYLAEVKDVELGEGTG